MKSNKQNKKFKELYDKESDVKWIVFKGGEEAYYQEIAPGFNIEFNQSGEIIGIEILDYAKRQLTACSFKSKDSDLLLYEPELIDKSKGLKAELLSFSNTVNL